MAAEDAAEAVERLRDPPTPFEEALELLQLWHAYSPNAGLLSMMHEITGRLDKTLADQAAVSFLRDKITNLRLARINAAVHKLGTDGAEKLLGLPHVSVFGRDGKP